MFNEILQGKNKSVSSLRQIVFRFQNEQKLFIRDLKLNNFNHFSCLETINQWCLTDSEMQINRDDYVGT